MKIASKKQSPARSWRSGALVYGLAVSLMVGAGSTKATGIPVVDGASIFQDLGEIIEQAGRWSDTATHYKAQVAAMQAQLSKVKSLFSSLGLKPGMTMTKVAEDAQVEELCGGGVMKDLWGSFTLAPKGDYYTQQKTICTNIQMARNRKYNETVDYMTSYKAETEADFQTLKTAADSRNEPGDVAKAQIDASAMQSKMDTKFKNYELQMKMYDSYIDVMQENQRQVAQTALKGNRGKDLLGQIGKTAILKAALDF